MFWRLLQKWVSARDAIAWRTAAVPAVNFQNPTIWTTNPERLGNLPRYHPTNTRLERASAGFQRHGEIDHRFFARPPTLPGAHLPQSRQRPGFSSIGCPGVADAWPPQKLSRHRVAVSPPSAKQPSLQSHPSIQQLQKMVLCFQKKPSALANTIKPQPTAVRVGVAGSEARWIRAEEVRSSVVPANSFGGLAGMTFARNGFRRLLCAVCQQARGGHRLP